MPYTEPQMSGPQAMQLLDQAGQFGGGAPPQDIGQGAPQSPGDDILMEVQDLAPEEIGIVLDFIRSIKAEREVPSQGVPPQGLPPQGAPGLPLPDSGIQPQI